MQTTALGRTGLTVSVVGLGGGGHSRLGQAYGRSHADSVAVVRRAIDLGVDFVDTAFVYGTEAIVGEAIRASGERVALSTKCAMTRDDRLIRGDELVRFAEKSLERLGLDTIDVYNLHGVGLEQYDYCRAELVPALIKLKEEGKIRFPGITERFHSDPSHAMLARALDDDFFDVMMVGFNLLNPSAARTVFPRTQAAGVGTQIMFAVRRALSRSHALEELIGGLIERGELDASELDPDRPLDFLLEGADSIVEAAYRFCRHTPGADVILTGTGNLEHLEQNVRFLQGAPLSPALLEKLERCFGEVDSVTGN
jgi:L-galactose dehydrogenase